MPYNGSGVYSTLAGTTAVPATTVASAPYNANVADLAQALNSVVLKNGLSIMTGPLNLSGNAVSALQAVTLQQIQAGSGFYPTIAAATASTIMSTINTLFLDGYAAEGDAGRGAIYISVANSGGLQPYQFQSNAGQRRWQLANERVSVGFFGAKGDASTDDYQSFVNALAFTAGGILFVPNPTAAFYKIGTATITIPANTRIIGTSKITTQIKHAFNGDMFIMSDASSLESVYLEGDGANFTGGAMVFNGTDGRQVRRDVRAYNFQGPIESFGVNAGSQSYCENPTYRRTGGVTGSGLYAVVMSATQQLGAVPKTYIGYQSEGYVSFDFGGSNDTFISGSFLADLNYTTDTRGCSIVNSRIANQTALTVNGHNNTIIGNDINPQITIASGADNIHIGPNSYNSLPIIDNSGNPRNTITHHNIAYTPVITTGGTAFSLGNGILSGTVSRTGSTTTITGNLQFGTTTVFGTGGYSVSLPNQRFGADVFQDGSVICSHGGISYIGILQIAGNVSTAQFIRDTTGSITFNSPATWVAGDTMRWSITYTN